MVSWNGPSHTPILADSFTSDLSSATLKGTVGSFLGDGSFGANSGPNVYFTGTGINGKIMQFTLTVASSPIPISSLDFLYSHSGGIAASIFWTYQINGGSGNNLFSTALGVTGSDPTYVSSGSINLSSIGNLSAGSTLLLTGTFTASGADQTIRFDNINFNASPIPEPVHWALLAFGCVFAGVRGRRFFMRGAH